jgi:cyclophilin family peptidyl-prolyl cis-trans isomerase
LSGDFADTGVPANTVFINTTLGVVPVELTPGATPLTVANFLSYVDSGAYDGSFFHRSVPGFVVQGGGYDVANNQVETITTNPAVQNEPGQSNVRGTVAMAKLGTNPNSATDQFFFNLADNSSNLDGQNGGFTVFGNVIGNGMTVVDAMAALNIASLQSPFDALPVIGSADGDIAFNQLVYINSVTKGSSYTVTSDNTSVLQVGVNDSAISYLPGSDGTAHVTVAATGLDGQMVSQTFTVTVGGPVAAGTATLGKGKTVTYKDKDGTVATLAMSGPGSAVVNFGGTGVTVKTVKGVTTVTGKNLVVQDMVLTGGTAATVITVATKGGNGMVDMGEIVTTGAMGSFEGAGVNLLGPTQVGGAIKELDVKSLAAAGSISAASMGVFTTSGNALGIVTVTGAVNTVGVLGTLGGSWSVGSLKTLGAGKMTNATIVTTTGGIGTVVTTKIANSSLRTPGSITSLTATGISSSEVAAGITSDGNVATGAGQIGLLRIGVGVKGTVFANSLIAAKTIKIAAFGSMSDAASTATFDGIEAFTITQMTGMVNGKAFAISKASTQAKVDQELAKEKVKLKNLKIEIV